MRATQRGAFNNRILVDIVTLLLLAIGLCFDSFAVSLTCGMSSCGATRRRMVRFAAVLGILQGVMPMIGWTLAIYFHSHISSYDHWIALILLVFLGTKMIIGSFQSQQEGHESPSKSNPFSWVMNLTLGVATSIDALAAGIAMAMVTLTIMPNASQYVNMILAISTIAIITLCASLVGLYLGRRSRGKLGSRAELIGGIILIAIGVKIVLEHTLN